MQLSIATQRTRVLGWAVVCFSAVAAGKTLCGEYDHYTPQQSNYTFSNNLWGDDGSGSQCTEVNESSRYSTTWQWHENDDRVHSYSNVGFNDTTALPLQLSDMATLTLALNWSMAAAATARAPSLAIDIDSLSAASTKANVAVDMFLDANAQKAKLSTAAAYETMIWIGTVGGVQPFHSQNTSDPPTFDLSGTTFSLFMGPNQSNQTVFTWLASSNLTSLAPGHDFSPLLRYLYQHDLLPASTYLGTYQVGTETYHATKKVVFAAEAIQMGVGRKGGTSAPAPVGGSEQKKSDGVHVIGQARWGAIALVGCVLGLLVL